MKKVNKERAAIFAKNLELLLWRTEAKQLDLADHIGVGRETVSNWISTRTTPGMNSLFLVIDYFSEKTGAQLTMDDLFSSDYAALVTKISQKAAS